MSGEPRTDLFLGLTRPPQLFGIPFQWVGFSIIGCFILFMLTKTFFAYLLYLVFHGVGLILSRRDANFMNVFITRFKQCPRVPNAGFWRANSYEP